MGKMIFIAEGGKMIDFYQPSKITDFFQPRKGAENLIDRIGAWLTKQGAAFFANVVYAITVAYGILKLVSWVIQKFHESFFSRSSFDYRCVLYGFVGHLCFTYSLAFGLYCCLSIGMGV